MIQFIERWAFRKSLEDPEFFRQYIRKRAYKMAKGDPERVHEIALEKLVEHEEAVREVAPRFDFPNLHINLHGFNIMPFGTAAGLDKNGDALSPLSYLFGFLEPGTVVVDQRVGNQRPRVVVDEFSEEVYNAQGFPSKGLEYFVNKVSVHRKHRKTPLFISICGIPPEPEKLDTAYRDLEILCKILDPFADGFVWNPFSPNTAALTALRTPKEFRTSAQLITSVVGKRKLKLVKMGPYDQGKNADWLQLIAAWIEGGGDGIIAVNTYLVPKDNVPSIEWGYPSAGRSGKFLQIYRQRAIADARANFPKAVIIATGGIDSANQAWQALEAGADLLEGYTPYTFHGFGLLQILAKGLEEKLKSSGFKSLEEYISYQRKRN